MQRNPLFVVPLFLCALHADASPVVAPDELAALERLVPQAASECDDRRAEAFAQCSADLETWAADLVWRLQSRTSPQVIADLRALIRIDQRVDRLLGDLVELRTQFAELPAGPARRASLNGYLATTSTIIDLSGRLKYLLHDAVDTASYTLETSPKHLEQLLDLLTAAKLTTGAVVMSYVLFDPLPDTEGITFSRETKRKTLRLIREARAPRLLGDLADFLQESNSDVELAISAAEAIQHIGLPQASRPDESGDALAPPITAWQLRRQLAELSIPEGNAALAQRRDALLSWLEQRVLRGVAGDSYRMGNLDLRRGDWLLMRNPSPYNRFTDLSPGLFTHVGVVTTEVGSDGIRRFVIVDLPERGDRIPAHNVEAYLSRSLHYVFLRHDDRAVANRMGDVAQTLIGNETQFDLTFRTERLDALRDQPLKGKVINTYCAGFLLLCAQRTGRPRGEFFPIPEFPAGGHCLDNLKVLGLSIGDKFVSPTGAFFSTHLSVVGQCQPLYDPTREVKEAVYDHFADSLVSRRLVPSPDMTQKLVQKLAEASKSNRWLARALARANNVSEHLDLESAAKAAAVIQILDDIADDNMEQFAGAWEAIAESADPAEASGNAAADDGAWSVAAAAYRKRHADLTGRWQTGQLSPRQLRVELVEYYTRRGREQLDGRFFPTNR